MTAPNTEYTTLTRNLGDGNPDGLLIQGVRITAMANANATLTAAQMINAIVTMTQDANYTLTTDTYANIANAVGATSQNSLRPQPANAAFDMSIVTLGSTANTVVTLAGGTGVTLSGNASHGLTVATPISKSGTWRFVFNSNGTITAYRLT